MILEDILIQFGIVITASLIGSFIFSTIFLKVIKITFVSSAAKLISREAKEKVTTWLQESIKNGIGDALKDPKIKKVVTEILDIIKEKLLKEEDKSKEQR